MKVRVRDAFGRIGTSAAMVVCLMLSPAARASDEEDIAKVANLLRTSAYRFTQLTPKIWSINFVGKALPKYKVLIAGGSVSVIFSTIVRHSEFNLTLPLAQKLLKFDSSFDRVKIGLDNDGDIFVRTDVTARTLDEQEFKAVVEQVGAASDEVYGGIKTMLGHEDATETRTPSKR